MDCKVIRKRFVATHAFVSHWGCNHLSLLHPLAAQPSIEHVQASNRLVVRNHVTASVQTHEREVAGALDRADLGLLVRK